jgi:hypothetical protein
MGNIEVHPWSAARPLGVRPDTYRPPRPFVIFPAEAGTHFCHGHRPSPVWQRFGLPSVRIAPLAWRPALGVVVSAMFGTEIVVSNRRRISPSGVFWTTGPHTGGEPCHPDFRRPSTMWAWSSGLIHDTRLRTYLLNESGAISMAFFSASSASSVRPSWPREAASQR